jgi:hypothetical protein
MLGYECVWITLVPIQLAELIFSDRRNERWLGNKGLIISAVIFVLGSFIAWAAWIKRARPIVFHARIHPSLGNHPRGAAGNRTSHPRRIQIQQNPAHAGCFPYAPSPWVTMPAAMVMCPPWYWLISLIFGSRSPLPFWIPIIIALLWAALVYLVIRYWSSSTRWQDIDRWALVFGATLACMIAGFSGSSHWPRIDLIGKAILNVLAVIGLLLLAARIRQTSSLSIRRART